jgi:hypothetical protein
MFILDSLLVSGLRWVLDTVTSAADAEMNDDAALREELIAAEMRRELGEISDEEFAAIEAGLLDRIREIRERREGGSGPIAFGGAEEAGGTLAVEATVAGDFHEPSSPGTGAAPVPLRRGGRAPRRAPARSRRKIRKP